MEHTKFASLVVHFNVSLLTKYNFKTINSAHSVGQSQKHTTGLCLHTDTEQTVGNWGVISCMANSLGSYVTPGFPTDLFFHRIFLFTLVLWSRYFDELFRVYVVKLIFHLRFYFHLAISLKSNKII